jgi:polyisoprenoid-binding protein YceI
MDNYPEITFVSTEAKQLDATTFQLTGDLTIRGVTNSVTVDFEFQGAVKDPWGKTRVGFEGQLPISRKGLGHHVERGS